MDELRGVLKLRLVTIVELSKAMMELETEVARFEKNCVEINNLQVSLLTICRIWSAWFLPSSQLTPVTAEPVQSPDVPPQLNQ